MRDADQIIKDLQMVSHPEGGHFTECLRTVIQALTGFS